MTVLTFRFQLGFVVSRKIDYLSPKRFNYTALLGLLFAATFAKSYNFEFQLAVKHYLNSDFGIVFVFVEHLFWLK